MEFRHPHRQPPLPTKTVSCRAERIQPLATDRPYSPDEVADRLEIEQVIARYVHALDARDYDILDDVFLPDTRFDLTEAGRIAPREVQVTGTPRADRIAERSGFDVIAR
jgi:hypothetical protein